MTVIGWDVGGAHLKGARVEDGRLVAAVEIACPLWQGLDRLDAAFAEARPLLGDARRHAVTMTGELSDIFASRAEGVRTLCSLIAKSLPGEIRVYGGPAGWLSVNAAASRSDVVASANWHATASLVAPKRGDALFADMGSTTTDLIPIVGGRLAARGFSDAERIVAGELVYSGAVRTFLMAVAQRVPFRGAWTPVMNEYFASIADVHRILGALPGDADRHPAADSREKTVAASCARLARMIGRDADDAEFWEWRNLAAFFAEAQLHELHRATLQVTSAAHLPEEAPLVAAGSGAFILEKLAARLGRRFEPWAALVPASPEAARMAGVCAPAAAVALLFAAGTLPSPLWGGAGGGGQ
jgi:probable H4MPT-linked C1 transfer pathway protein